MTRPARLVLELPEAPSVNKLLRMHHTQRTAIRNAVAAHALQQRPRGWKRLKRFRLDAELRLHSLRDPLELPACLKLHVDALIQAGIIADDSRKHLVVGEVTQVVARKHRGARIWLREAS